MCILTHASETIVVTHMDDCFRTDYLGLDDISG